MNTVLLSGITAILRKIGCHEQTSNEVTVAIGGSMFKEHHLFVDRVKNMVAQLMGKDCKVELKLQPGGFVSRNITFKNLFDFSQKVLVEVQHLW